MEKGNNMNRVQVDLPSQYCFETELSVRINNINIGGHLGHDALVSLLHEARARLFAQMGFGELEVNGSGIIMADLAVLYLAEAHYQDLLRIRIAIADWTQKSCAFYYQVLRTQDYKEIARARTGLVFYNYKEARPQPAPDIFRAAVRALPGLTGWC